MYGRATIISDVCGRAVHFCWVQLSPCDLSPTVNVREAANRKLTLQTGMAICIGTINLSVTVNLVSHLFPPIWDFIFPLAPHRMNCGTLLFKAIVYERTQRSPSPCCAAAQFQESFSLEAMGAPRQLFLSFLQAKKQLNQATEPLLSWYPVKSPWLSMLSTGVLLYKYKAAIEDAQFVYTSFYIKV